MQRLRFVERRCPAELDPLHSARLFPHLLPSIRSNGGTAIGFVGRRYMWKRVDPPLSRSDVQSGSRLRRVSDGVQGRQIEAIGVTPRDGYASHA